MQKLVTIAAVVAVCAYTTGVEAYRPAPPVRQIHRQLSSQQVKCNPRIQDCGGHYGPGSSKPNKINKKKNKKVKISEDDFEVVEQVKCNPRIQDCGGHYGPGSGRKVNKMVQFSEDEVMDEIFFDADEEQVKCNPRIQDCGGHYGPDGDSKCNPRIQDCSGPSGGSKCNPRIDPDCYN